MSLFGNILVSWYQIFGSLFNLEGTRINKDGGVTERWGYSSAGRAPALQAGGQRFDPAYLHHKDGPVAQLARAYD